MDLIDRFFQIMRDEGLNPQQFAERVGLNRSALSHFKSGRNKPSLDVVLRILNEFPHIDSSWLLGITDRSEPDVEFVSSGASDGIMMLNFEEEEEEEEEFDAIDEDEIVELPIEKGDLKELIERTEPSIPSEIVVRRPVRMMIFYSDSTFETFQIDKYPF